VKSMAKSEVVYVCVCSGDEKHALGLVRSRWAAAEIRVCPYRRLRESGFGERIRLLWGFRGRAMVFCVQSLGEAKHKKILECTQFFHRCQETVLCDESGRWDIVRTVDIFRAGPGVLFSILLDITTLIFWRCYLRLWLWRTEPVSAAASGRPTEIAYLIPNPRSIGSGGGAISHVRGFLYALKAAGTTCRVFSGTALAQDAFKNEIIAAQGRRCFFSGAALLSYNFEFARGVQQYLGSEAPGFLYQRHFPLSIAGALLSRRLKVPFILEYNGSEAWIADYWDPSPLRNWIRMCEEVMLRCAARIVVVSEALRSDLLERGIHPERIRVNPNGVDASYFYPGCGRTRGRTELDIKPDEVLIGFVGSFSLWHGIEILQQAIIKLLSHSPPCRLRFVLMGNGLLHAEMCSALAAYEISGEVIFIGPLPHEKVAEYLDASDILVSPHIPMPDGSRFFGSPTKLFEYMAMGKGIVASRLEQLAEVLAHDQTAWLVTPGNVDELAEAILRLAHDPAKRQALGAAARRAAIERHSWTRNVAWALSDMPFREVTSSVAGEGFREPADSSTLLP
jgi:glycosyltransferase involved in cell wall biosynthesis